MSESNPTPQELLESKLVLIKADYEKKKHVFAVADQQYQTAQLAVEIWKEKVIARQNRGLDAESEREGLRQRERAKTILKKSRDKAEFGLDLARRLYIESEKQMDQPESHLKRSSGNSRMSESDKRRQMALYHTIEMELEKKEKEQKKRNLDQMIRQASKKAPQPPKISLSPPTAPIQVPTSPSRNAAARMPMEILSPIENTDEKPKPRFVVPRKSISKTANSKPSQSTKKAEVPKANPSNLWPLRAPAPEENDRYVDYGAFIAKKHRYLLPPTNDAPEELDESSQLARMLEDASRGKRKPGLELGESSGDVTISGTENSNSGDEVLTIPTSINGEVHVPAVTSDEHQSRLISGPTPQGNVAVAAIREEQKLLEKRLNFQASEADHFDKSAVIGRSIKYVLQPSSLDRQNFFQSRGSSLPSWFPGMFTVFPDTQRPMKASPESVFFTAWQKMSPFKEYEKPIPFLDPSIPWTTNSLVPGLPKFEY